MFFFLGGAYFLWHWGYFGYPLPNPFYKKGGGLLHWDSFWESLGNLVRFGGPFLLAFVLGFRSGKTARLAAAFMIPLLGFAAAFVLISNETNFGGRFQYALWPLVLISWYPLVSGLPEELGLSWRWPAAAGARLVWVAAFLVCTYALVRYSTQQNCALTSAQQSCAIAYEADGRYDAARMLSEYQGKGYVLATSEAGLLPFYSNWPAIDAWGLNDEWIAHHGDITRAIPGTAQAGRHRVSCLLFPAGAAPLDTEESVPGLVSHDHHPEGLCRGARIYIGGSFWRQPL